MSLSIQIKKESGSPSVLMVKRPDGTETYSKIQTDFEIHDIAHYVVEKQLGFKNAFYGLLLRGYQITDFQLPKDKRPKALWPQNMHQEALVTEHFVNLLTIDFMGSEERMNILETLKTILHENDLYFPKN